MHKYLMKVPCLAVFLLLSATWTSAEMLPGRLQGIWRISRILPTSSSSCWHLDQAESLLGSDLIYSQTSMRWKGGSVPLSDINTRLLNSEDFARENRSARFSQLGIHNTSVMEVDMQHEDMDITGSTTEVPGDSVLITGPNRIVVSACGVFFEAVRVPTSMNRFAYKGR